MKAEDTCCCVVIMVAFVCVFMCVADIAEIFNSRVLVRGMLL